MRRVLSVLVENEPGVLSRVAGLFSGRGFNIESLNVAPTLEDGVSLMTITTSGDEQIIEQIVKQLRKLVTVVKVVDFYGMAYVEREMMVIKVHAEESKRGEVLRIADIFRCKVVDVSLTDLTLEATGDHSKLQAIIQLLQKFGIKELARTGTLAVRVLCRATTSKTILKVAAEIFAGRFFFGVYLSKCCFWGRKQPQQTGFPPFSVYPLCFYGDGGYCQSLCSCVF